MNVFGRIGFLFITFFITAVCQAQNLEAVPNVSDIFTAKLQEYSGLSFEDLLSLHPRGLKSFQSDPVPFSVNAAKFFSDTISAFELSDAAVQTLTQLGFVVVPGSKTNAWLNPAHLYYEVFRHDQNFHQGSKPVLSL